MRASPPMTKEPETDAPPAAGNDRNQKLWAVLLVLDSCFVIIFGGALAKKLYDHWQQPAAVVTAGRKTKPHPPAKAEPPKAPEAAKPADPAKAAEAAKPPEAPKPQEPAKEAPAPKKAAKKPEPAAAPPGKSKALAVEFRLKARAKRVQLAGAFIVRGGRKDMVERSEGHWGITLYLTPNTYRYYFVIDGKKKLDPENANSDHGHSVMTVP